MCFPKMIFLASQEVLYDINQDEKGQQPLFPWFINIFFSKVWSCIYPWKVALQKKFIYVKATCLFWIAHPQNQIIVF